MWWKDDEAAKEVIEDIKSQDNPYSDWEVQYSKDKGAVIGDNVYMNDGTVDDLAKKSNFVHNVLKGSFIRPLIRYFMKKHRKDLHKGQLPDKYQYKKLNAFEKAFEDSLVDWNYKYQVIQKGKMLSKEECEKNFTKDNPTNDLLRFLKESYITVCANDTAYLEFHNIFMYNLVKQMKGVEGDHLLFIDGNINDAKYFVPVAKWEPHVQQLAQQLMANNIRFAEVIKDENGNPAMKIDFNKIPSFVRKENLPDEMPILK